MFEQKLNRNDNLRIHPRAIISRPVQAKIFPQTHKNFKTEADSDVGAMIDVSVTGAKIKLPGDFLNLIKVNSELKIYWAVVPGTHQMALTAQTQWIDKKRSLIGVEWRDLPLFSKKIIARLVFFHRS
jgi:hypothetical protein